MTYWIPIEWVLTNIVLDPFKKGGYFCDIQYSLVYQYRDMSSIFYNNSEENVSELLENIEEIFCLCSVTRRERVNGNNPLFYIYIGSQYSTSQVHEIQLMI